MKVALKQSAMPSSPTANQDFTDAIFNSDVKLLLPFFSRATANNTDTDGEAFSLGACDSAAAQGAISSHGADALVTTDAVGQQQSATQAALMANATTGASIAEAVGSLLNDGTPDGGRLAWTDWNANELINALLLGGSDVSASVATAALNGATPVSVTHGLGATPDIIIAFSICQVSGSNAGQAHCIGFHNVVGGTYAAVANYHGSGVGTTLLAQYLHTTAIALEINGGTVSWSATISSVGATTFDITASAATTDQVYFICLKVTGGVYKVGTFQTKTSTGTQADISGMASAPKLVIYLPTFMTALDSGVTSTTCEARGIGVAVNNEGVTEQGSVASWANDAVVLGDPTPTTDAKCRISNTKAGMIYGGSGTLAVDWSISSWDSGGVTNNYSTADGTGRYVPYLAIGVAAAPTFDTSPTVTSQTSSAYTIGYDADANATSIYVGAYTKDATAPTAAQLKAGTGALATATEATTGSADSIVLTVTESPPFPIYDVYAVLEGAGGFSSVVALVDEALDAPAGFQFVTVDVPWGAGEESILDGASPAAVDGDIIRCSAQVDSFSLGADAHTLTMAADGVPSVDPGQDTSRLSFEAHFYDVSVGAYSDAAAVTFYINNAAPVRIAPLTVLYQKDVAIASYALADNWSDDESDTLTVTYTDALPAGLSVTAGVISGTPTAYGNTNSTERAADITGDFTDQVVTYQIGDEVPVVVDTAKAAAIAAIENVASFTAVAGTPAYHATIAAGNIISTNPEGGTLVPYDQAVTYVESLGVAPNSAGRASRRRTGRGFVTVSGR